MDYTVSRRPVIVKAQGSIPEELMWDLWWTTWLWDTFCREIFLWHSLATTAPHTDTI